MIKSKNLGQFYRYVRNKSQHRSDVPPLRGANDSLVFSDHDKANALNNYFVSVCTSDNGVFPPFTPPIPKVPFQDLESMSINSIFSQLRKQKNVYSAGPDGIPPVFFKQLAVDLAFPIYFLFNSILTTGVLPAVWKSANVVPIYKKKGSISEPENYRPISLTCVACKLFESLVKSHLLHYLTVNDLISKEQHGFLNKKSTCTNLLEALNDWTSNIENNLFTFVLSLDFAKAFDSMSRPKLLYKLEKLGIHGKVLMCLKSFLDNRRQRVKIGKCFSDYKPIISGVPQGSVLGPLLFVIFINDITDVSSSDNTIKLFADDLKSYVAGRDLKCRDIFISTICKLLDWAKLWQLPVAFKKTNWCLISKGVVDISELSVYDNYFDKVAEVNDLGVKFNYKLDFSAHIDEVVSKAKQRIFLLNKCIVSKDPTVLINGFKTYVLPILDYNSQIWSPYLVGDINRIEAIQRNFLKHLKGFEGLTYSTRLIKANLCTLELRRLRADLMLCFKIVHNLIALSKEAFFTFDNNSITRGNKFKLKLVQVKSKARFNFFASRVVNVWNSLPDSAVCATSAYAFSKCINNLCFSKFLILQFD